MSRQANQARQRLLEAREAFKARQAALGIPDVWAGFNGRIAAVLAGGGARGGYEAGALLAIQDAGVPTHLITATSIGGINGASYAAHGQGFVGNAEPLVDAWFDLTPPTVGVEWTRYTWMIAGLVATFSGFTNLIYYLMEIGGYEVQLRYPALAWASLCLAGITVLLLHDHIPYVYRLMQRVLSGSRWRPARRMLAKSILANLVVAGFVVTVFWSLDVPGEFRNLFSERPGTVLLVLAGLIVLQQARRYAHPVFGRLWGRLLRLPFRTGMFSNFERTRHLKKYIPSEGLRTTQIRVVLTSTDLHTGSLRYFTNADPTLFITEPGVDRSFARRELVQLPNLMPAVIASSALPIAYEPYEIDGKLLADGALVGSQPIRPAIRLGADVLLMISMENPGDARAPMHTFIDVGMRALEILMQRNMHADVALLAQANGQIEAAASALAMRPEDLVIEFEGRMFRYVKAFAIKPDRPIENSILDFGGRATGDTILRGYIDACAKIEEFAKYAADGGFKKGRHTLPLELIKPRRSRVQRIEDRAP